MYSFSDPSLLGSIASDRSQLRPQSRLTQLRPQSRLTPLRLQSRLTLCIAPPGLQPRGPAHRNLSHALLARALTFDTATHGTKRRDTAGDADAGEMRSSDIAGSPENAGDADATKHHRSVHFYEPDGLLLKSTEGASSEQIMGDIMDQEHDEDDAVVSDADVSSCPSGECDSVGASTEDDMERGDLTAVAARRQQNAQPKARVVGDLHEYKPPAARNSMPEVGNIAMMVGNWGQRSADGGGDTALNREAHDRQVMGSPAQIMILLEASDAVVAMLEHEPEFVFDRPQSRPPGRAAYGNVKTRDWYEHYVVIGKEQDKPILMAARKNNCTGIECHTYEPWFDGPFKKKTEGRHHQNHDMHVPYEAKRRVFGYRD